MKDILNILSKVSGTYEGHGTNHEGQPFAGTLTLKPTLAGRGIHLTFRATGLSGTVFHEEESLIAPSLKEKLTLWNLNTNMPGLAPHELKSLQPKPDAQATFIFGFSDISDMNSFREEVTLDLWNNGDISYSYSWGMPGGDFKDRSSARMTRQG